MDRNAVDVLVRGTRLVAPGDVVAGVRGQHVHLGVARQVLGDVARVKLGAAVNRLTVSLYDDRELHCSSSDPPCPELGRRVRGPRRPCGPESETGAGRARRSGVRRHDPCGEPAGRAHDGGGWRAAAPAAPAPAALAALTGAFRGDAGPGAGRRRSRRPELPDTGRALRTGWAGRVRDRASADRGRPRSLPLFIGLRPVQHGAFERPCAPLAEVDPGIQRLHAHPEVLDLDAEPRRFDDEVVNQLVIQLMTARVEVVDLRLHVQHVDERVRIEEQLEQRPQQPANPLGRRRASSGTACRPRTRSSGPARRAGTR